MYLLNRSIFVILYIGTFLFSMLLGLKQQPFASGLFLVVMNLIIFFVSKKVQTIFVQPSLTLALTNARIIDEATKRLDERIEKFHERKAQKRKKKRSTRQKDLTPLALKRDEASPEKIGSSSKIHIEVRKEDNADQIKQRRKEYRKKSEREISD